MDALNRLVERFGDIPALKQKAADCVDIDILYQSIREDEFFLERIDLFPFFETPLHKAASNGDSLFAMEIMRLKPSFARKPNLDGLSPIHLALNKNYLEDKNHLENKKHLEVVRRLLQVDGSLVRVKGKEGITPLHYAAEKGDVKLLDEFLSFCPDSIEDVTIRNETALHVALTNNRLEAFTFLVGWLRKNWTEKSIFWERTVLNWKDKEGNTVLHVAVSKNENEAVNLLLNCGVDIKANNLKGETAAVLLKEQRTEDTREIRGMLWSAGAFSPPVPTSCIDCLKSAISPIEKMIIYHRRQHTKITNDMRNALLVVAVLIVAVTYQAVLSPPGGVWQDNSNPITIDNQFNTTDNQFDTTASNSNVITSPHPHKAGTLVMGTTLNADIFVLANSVTFYLSIAIVFFLIPIDSTSGMVSITLGYLSICYLASMAAICTSLIMTGILATLPVAVVAQLFVLYDCYGACQRALEICKGVLCKAAWKVKCDEAQGAQGAQV